MRKPSNTELNDDGSIANRVTTLTDAASESMLMWKIPGVMLGIIIWVSLIVLFRSLDGVGTIQPGSGTELAYLLFVFSPFWLFLLHRAFDDVLKKVWEDWAVYKYARYVLSIGMAGLVIKDTRGVSEIAPADLAGMGPEMGNIVAALILLTAASMFLQTHEDELTALFGRLRSVVE